MLKTFDSETCTDYEADTIRGLFAEYGKPVRNLYVGVKTYINLFGMVEFFQYKEPHSIVQEVNCKTWEYRGYMYGASIWVETEPKKNCLFVEESK